MVMCLDLKYLLEKTTQLAADNHPILLSKVIIVTMVMCFCLQIAMAKPGTPVIGQSLRYCNPLPLEASSQDGSPSVVSS